MHLYCFYHRAFSVLLKSLSCLNTQSKIKNQKVNFYSPNTEFHQNPINIWEINYADDNDFCSSAKQTHIPWYSAIFHFVRFLAMFKKLPFISRLMEKKQAVIKLTFNLKYFITTNLCHPWQKVRRRQLICSDICYGRSKPVHGHRTCSRNVVCDQYW